MRHKRPNRRLAIVLCIGAPPKCSVTAQQAMTNPSCINDGCRIRQGSLAASARESDAHSPRSINFHDVAMKTSPTVIVGNLLLLACTKHVADSLSKQLTVRPYPRSRSYQCVGIYPLNLLLLNLTPAPSQQEEQQLEPQPTPRLLGKLHTESNPFRQIPPAADRKYREKLSVRLLP